MSTTHVKLKISTLKCAIDFRCASTNLKPQLTSYDNHSMGIKQIIPALTLVINVLECNFASWLIKTLTSKTSQKVMVLYWDKPLANAKMMLKSWWKVSCRLQGPNTYFECTLLCPEQQTWTLKASKLLNEYNLQITLQECLEIGSSVWKHPFLVE